MLDSSQIFVLEDENRVAQFVAARIFDNIKIQLANNRRFVLGCPGGRTPRQTYIELGKLIAQSELSLKNLWILMMDDYAEKTSISFQNVSDKSHFSCRKFAQDEIYKVLNGNLSSERCIPAAQVITPDAAQPEIYERFVSTHGIDLFILAAGATDGHVAFNGPGSKITDRTRIYELARTTRADNLLTFPDFKSIDDVPKYGITIGPANIKESAKTVIMILIGESKSLAYNRITAAASYQTDWPATVTVECRNPILVADKAAASINH